MCPVRKRAPLMRRALSHYPESLLIRWKNSPCYLFFANYNKPCESRIPLLICVFCSSFSLDVEKAPGRKNRGFFGILGTNASSPSLSGTWPVRLMRAAGVHTRSGAEKIPRFPQMGNGGFRAEAIVLRAHCVSCASRLVHPRSACRGSAARLRPCRLQTSRPAPRGFFPGRRLPGLPAQARGACRRRPWTARTRLPRRRRARA